MGLKGKIESITDSQYTAKEKDGEILPGDLLSVEKHTFNDQGQITSNTHYDRDGEKKLSITNEFTDGKCTMVKICQHYSDIDEITTTQTLVSVSPTLEIWDIKTSSGDNGQAIIEIDESKQNKFVTNKDSDGKMTNTAYEKYDERGNLIENKITDQDYSTIHWIKSSFDKNNQETERKLLSEEYDVNISFTYDKIDKRGNWTNKIVSRNGRIESIIVREIKYSE